MAWNRSSEKKVEEKGRGRRWNGRLKGLVAGVVVVLGAGIVAWLVWFSDKPQTSNPEPQTPISRIREVKPKAVERKAVRAEQDSPKEEKTNVWERTTYLGRKVVKVNVYTNDDGLVWERIFTDDGKKHRFYHYKPMTFRHPTDNYLALVLSASGTDAPPLPDLSNEKDLEKKFRESLKDEIKIGEDDDEKTKDIKQKVIAARSAMEALLERGYSFSDVIALEHSNYNSDLRTRDGVVRGYMELLRTGAREDAEAYRIAVNLKLSEMGLEEIEEVKGRK